MASKSSRPARSVTAQTQPSGSKVSRRSLLTKGIAAAAGGASVLGVAALAGQTTIQAQTPIGSRQRFRAYVRIGTGASVRELRLLPISPRQVVLRSEAAQICYTTTPQVLGSTDASQPFIPGHGGVGTVIEIGSRVNRVAVGDRVVVAGTRQCGQCYNCIRGRADHCLLTNGGGDPNAPIAEMSDGTKVTGFTPCCSELMVVFEESCVPVFTRVSSVELAMLHDTGLCGLAATMTKVRVEAGSDVVVLGAGPIGLAAVQGARIQGAAQIISVDPIRYRREAALALGATIALDPNVEGSRLVQRIQDLCKGKTDRRLAGGGNVGPDFVIEAVGGDLFPPKTEVGPDPTGILSLQQAWQLCSPVGHVVTTSGGHPLGSVVTIPANQWANAAKSHQPGNLAGANPMRDIPRFVRLIEAGLFNAKALATDTFPLERTREAFQAAADRTTIGAVMVYA
jgi:S-(hydroxymethyl)glutathione dehydrogenase / alcohol dehydrogenase